MVPVPKPTQHNNVGEGMCAVWQGVQRTQGTQPLEIMIIIKIIILTTIMMMMMMMMMIMILILILFL